MRLSLHLTLLAPIVVACLLAPGTASSGGKQLAFNRHAAGDATRRPRYPSRGLIAFSCVNCGVTAYLAAIRPDGRRLREIGGDIEDARWSPDGRSVVYARNGSIRLDRLAGSVDRSLTNPHGKVYGGDRDPTWSPDGKHVVFVRGDGAAAALWTIGVDGRGSRFLSRPRTGVGTPDVSPDGRQIVYSDPSGNVWLVRAGGTGRHQPGPGTGIEGFDPRWAPDGTRLAYLTQSDGTLRILTLSSNVVRTIHAGDDQPVTVAWSPDGHWLAVAEEHDYDCNDPTGPCTLDELWIVSATGPEQRRIYHTAESGAIASLDWSSSAR